MPKCEVTIRGLKIGRWLDFLSYVGCIIWKGAINVQNIIEKGTINKDENLKKGRGTLNSLEKFSNHNKFECAIKVSRNNYGYHAEQKLLTIPFYSFPFAAKDLADGKMEV